MYEIGAFEAQNTLDSLLDRVEQNGEEIIIARHGMPVARLIPNVGRVDQLQAHAAVERIRKRARQMKSTQFDWEKLKADRDRSEP